MRVACCVLRVACCVLRVACYPHYALRITHYETGTPVGNQLYQNGAVYVWTGYALCFTKSQDSTASPSGCSNRTVYDFANLTASGAIAGPELKTGWAAGVTGYYALVISGLYVLV